MVPVPLVKVPPDNFNAIAVAELALSILDPQSSIPANTFMSPVKVWIRLLPKFRVPPPSDSPAPKTLPVRVATSPACFWTLVVPVVVNPPIDCDPAPFIQISPELLKVPELMRFPVKNIIPEELSVPPKSIVMVPTVKPTVTVNVAPLWMVMDPV